MISLRSAASTARVSAPFDTPFSDRTYLYLGITLGRGAAIEVPQLGLDRMGLATEVGRKPDPRGFGRGFGGYVGCCEGRRVDVQRVVAGRQMPVSVVHERRLELVADLGRIPAARVEPAAGLRGDPAPHIPPQPQPPP